MRIEIFINPKADSVSEVLRELLRKVTKMSVQLDDLTAKVTALQTVDASAVALLQGLKVKLDEAIAGGDLAVIQTLSDQIGISTQALADAVTANTPAE
jgi:hypothetical protein